MFSIDRVRPAVETELLEVLLRHGGRTSPREPPSELESRCLRLTPAMVPDLYSLLAEAKTALGVTDDIIIFQSSGSLGSLGGNNACMHYRHNPPAIEMIGQWLAMLEPQMLLAVLGHELGHFVAHGPNTAASRVAHMDFNIQRDYGLRDVHNGFRLCTEVTADRCGLIACGDIEAALKLEMVTIAGLPPTAVRWNVQDYLEQCKQHVDELRRSGKSPYHSSHPGNHVRGYLVWLYYQSTTYKELTGTGPGILSPDELDAEVEDLLFGNARPRIEARIVETSGQTVHRRPRQESDIERRLQQAVQSAARGISNAVDRVAPRVSRLFSSRVAPHVEDEEFDLDLEDDREAELRRKFEELEKRFKK